MDSQRDHIVINHVSDDGTIISAARRREIDARLAAIEQQEGVRILYACESGSRAWGFPSADSDFDVRFLHMAKGNIREYLKGERVWVKKYFYVLRPLLACRWIEAGLGVVPMEFGKLVDSVQINAELRDAIQRLLRDKLAGREMDDGPRICPHEHLPLRLRYLIFAMPFPC
jgi:predicted nucleotidyltransferase